MSRLTYATRRFIFGVVIFLNTALFGLNLFKEHDQRSALVNFLTCCMCWIGIYIIGWSEQLELSKQENKAGDEDDNDNE